MITMNYVLWRQPHLTREEFQHWMKEVHGPRVAGHGSSLQIERYAQCYTIDDPFNDYVQGRRGFMEPCDGVDQFWWENRQDLVDALASPNGKEALADIVDDERKFVDFERSSLWLSMVYPQINPNPDNGFVAREKSPYVEMISFQRPAQGLTDEEGVRYWLMNHASLVRLFCDAIRCYRYIHQHRIDDPITDELRAARGQMDDTYMGQCESWWNRLESAWVMQSPEMATFMTETLHEDEKNYCDHARSIAMIVKERLFIER